MMLEFHEKSGVRGHASGISHAAVEHLKSHPFCAAAIRDFLAGTIAMYEANPMLNRILSDRGRAVVSLFALYLHYIPPPGEHEAGLTLTRLQSLCRSTDLCSNGRAAALVSVLRFGRYLAPGIGGHDRRRRVLVPTDRFLQEQKQRWRLQFEAMVPLFDSAQTILGALDHPDFAPAFLRRLGASYFGGFRVVSCVPVLADLIEHTAALLMLGELLLRAGDEPLEREGRPVAVSTSAVARRFGVARAHVRTVLVEAEQAGLVDCGAREGQVIVLPALASAIESFFAAAFLLFATCGDLAIGDIGLRPERPRRAIC